MEMSGEIKELADALSKAQGEMKGAAKDSANPFFKSKYADLASVWEAFRVPFTKHGLAMVQSAHSDEKSVTIVTMLTHSSGQWIRESLTLFPKDSSPQSFGSAITYGRRYAAQSMAGVCPEDDDGNAASGQTKQAPVTPTVSIAKETRDQFYQQCKECIARADTDGLHQLWDEWDSDSKIVLWGMFNSQERSTMKKLMGKD